MVRVLFGVLFMRTTLKPKSKTQSLFIDEITNTPNAIHTQKSELFLLIPKKYCFYIMFFGMITPSSKTQTKPERG